MNTTRTIEDELVAAHKLGCAYARELSATKRKAQAKVQNTYARADLREAFVAGYVGTLKRMTTIVDMKCPRCQRLSQATLDQVSNIKCGSRLHDDVEIVQLEIVEQTP